MFYTSKYMTKSQNSSHNSSAVLASHFRNPNQEDRYMTDMLTANKVMLFRCFLSLNYEMEYSGPQVATYLLGNTECIRSHDYATLYWSSVEALLRRRFPEFCIRSAALWVFYATVWLWLTKQTSAGSNTSPENTQANAENRETLSDECEDVVTLTLLNDAIIARSQLVDYMLRGRELESFSLLTFARDSYERDVDVDRERERENVDDVNPLPGRRRHVRSLYLPAHSHYKKKCRVIRPANHKNLLSIPGQYFPRNNVPERYDFYCASMLALLKPWRDLSDLRARHPSWSSAFAAFRSECDQQCIDILVNIQFFYESADATERRRRNRNHAPMGVNAAPEESGHGPQDAAGSGLEEDDPPFLDIASGSPAQIADMLSSITASQTSLSARLHGEQAVSIARMCGLFPENNGDPFACGSIAVRPSGGGDLADLENWKLALRQASSQLTATYSGMTNPEPLTGQDVGSVNNLSHSSAPESETSATKWRLKT
jgi:hypothetical protein